MRELVDGGLLERYLVFAAGELAITAFNLDLLAPQLAHQGLNHIAQLLRVEPVQLSCVDH